MTKHRALLISVLIGVLSLIGLSLASADTAPTVTQQQATDALATLTQFVQQHPDVTPTPSASVTPTPSASVTPTPSATPSVTPTPSATPVSCVWPTCFPTSTTTGPTGTLTAVSGDLTVSSGTVTGKAISGVLRVTGGTTAAPVIVKNSTMAGVIGCGTCVWQLTDSRVDAHNTDSTGYGYAVEGGSFTLLRVEITRAWDSIRLDGSNKSVLVKDSVIHNQFECPTGCHTDGVQYYEPGSAGNITFDHDEISGNITNSGQANSALMIGDNPKGVKVTLTHNRFSSAGFSLRLYDGVAGSGDVYTVTENTVTKGSYGYGPCLLTYTVPFDGTSGWKWAGNVYSDGTTWAPTDC